jgi:glucose-6-phosphate 1-dehydrogenase
MALPPNVFTPVAQGLKKNVYPEKGIARLIVSLLLFRYLI